MNPTQECLNQLARIMRKTINSEDIILLSDFFTNRGNDETFKSLIYQTKNHLSEDRKLIPHLLSALESYDCTSEFPLIADLIAYGSYHEAWYAIDLINAMEGPFNKLDLGIALKKLNTISNEFEKKELIVKYENWLKEKLENLDFA